MDLERALIKEATGTSRAAPCLKIEEFFVLKTLEVLPDLRLVEDFLTSTYGEGGKIDSFFVEGHNMAKGGLMLLKTVLFDELAALTQHQG
jgi:hypothetical protein